MTCTVFQEGRALTSEIKLGTLASLHNVRVNPNDFDEIVEHYSIPAWNSLEPELVQSGDIESTKIILPDEEHILVSCLNPSTHKVWRVGKSNSNLKRLASTEWAVVIPHNTEETDFINSALEGYHFQFQMNAYVTGTTNSHQRVKKPDFLHLTILFPEKNIRDKIGNLHSCLRRKLVTNKKITEYCSGYISYLYRSWFIDFDPVKAKAKGKLPYGMGENTAALFPDTLEDSEIGPIPTGWAVGTIHDIAKQRKDTVRPDDFGDMTPYIGLEHMPRKSIALTEWGGSAGLDSNKFRFGKRDILFGKLRPYFHKVGPAPLDGVCSTDILVIQPIDDELGGFLLPILSSENFVNFVSGISEGVGLPRTKWDHFKLYKIALPPAEIIEKFTSIVRPLLDNIESSIYESKELNYVRDELLPELMSGELSVS